MPRVALAAATVVLAAHPASAQFSTLEANPTSEQAWAAVFEAGHRREKLHFRRSDNYPFGPVPTA